MQHDDNSAELDAFKTDINLSEYAAAQGYALEAKRSTKALTIMRKSDDIIIISRNAASGHDLFYAVYGYDDRGTIIDFIQTRQGLNLGQIRKELRPWIGSDPYRSKPAPSTYAPRPEAGTRDLETVRAVFDYMSCVEVHPYLIQRGITPQTQQHPRFAGMVYQDSKFKNAIFPHHDRDGLTGFEIKNKNFTGFAKGGQKSLWRSAVKKGDQTAVFAETAIDALSYAQIHEDAHTRYFSTGGAMNPDQPDLIASAAARMPRNATIIIAADHDEGGAKFTASLQSALQDANRPDLQIRRHSPDMPEFDWNRELQEGRGDSPAPHPLQV